MTCNKIQTLLVDYRDGGLDAARRKHVEAHLTACAPCAGLVREMDAVRSLLRELPARQTSANFEARLADRLAQVRRPAVQTPWWQALADGLSHPPQALRPALALGVAVIAVVGTLTYHPAATPVSPALPAVDTALISQCVALHQRDVAAQPLSDPAMQSVSAHPGGWNGDATASDVLEGNL